MQRKNTEPQLATYLHQKGKKLGSPIAGNFELTARCNFHCPMCYVHMSDEEVAASGKELTAAQWLEIARQARDQGMIFVLLTGGEPFMRRDFFEIYHGMKQMGLLISINSNGSMLRGEILERLLEDPPFRINISLYGGCDETYQRMCGRPVYHQVKENIRALKAAGVDVSLNLSITPYNCCDLARIYADAVELDVNVKASSYMYPPVRINGEQYGCNQRLSSTEAARCQVQWDELRFSDEEFAIRAENTRKLVNEHKDGCTAEIGEGITCRAGSTSFGMTLDGKMMPCGMMTTPVVYPLEQGFGPAWQELREKAGAIRTPAQCLSCDHKELCGVCAAVCFTETGRFDGVPAYVCQKTHEQVRITGEVYEKRKRK